MLIKLHSQATTTPKVRAAPGPRRQGLRRIAGTHGNVETIERGLGGG